MNLNLHFLGFSVCQVHSEILETLVDSVRNIAIKSMLINLMLGLCHLIFESVNKMLNKISFSHEVEVFHGVEMVLEMVLLFKLSD